jgi:farnesyl diphosphate synthase
MTTEAFAHFRLECGKRLDRLLDQHLPSGQQPPGQLHQAMRYAALAPGKRVRPLLTYATGLALDAPLEPLDSIALAVELIHAFSLVHDDLPAMDDDDLRRGRPTCHKAFDEATAILAGDALQTQAFLILARDESPLAPETRLRIIETLAQATGSHGMAGGQALDMAAEGQILNLLELEQIHIHKTGALIRASVIMAALASGATEAQSRTLAHYAGCLGLAFQIQDDILDLQGDTASLGKTQGKDLSQNKATYPALLGLEGARDKAQELIKEALLSLEAFGPGAGHLRSLAAFVLKRQS